MKRKFIFLAISILVAATFFSCSSKTVKTEEKDFTKRLYLTNDTAKGSLNIDIEVEFPVKFRDNQILDSIRSSIISNVFGDDYIKLPDDSVIPHFVKDIYDDYVENNLPLVHQLDSGSVYSFNNEHTVSGFSLLSDQNIYVYGIERYVYMGGAHGLETRNYYNYSLRTGKLISENDLYTGNYIQNLSDLIKKRIVEQSHESGNQEPILSLEDTDYWTDSIKPNGNFYITDESINYVFNPYEIAPYSMGETEVVLPFDRIRSYLKSDSPIAYLVKKFEKTNKKVQTSE